MKKTASQIFSEGPWFVYIIECEDKTLYTGICKNPVKRFKTHLAGRGAQYTKIHKPSRFMFLEEYESHSPAFQREIQIKKMSAEKKRKLCSLLKISDIITRSI